MDNEGAFDVAILGTGLTESIAAAALAKAGFKVVHLDENPYYGGQEASLSLDELVQWADDRTSTNDAQFTSITRSSDSLPQSRQYSICLCPSVIPSIGPIISSLVSSGVSKYGGFRLLERVGVYHPSGLVKNVPGTKEDVFKSKDMTLIDKRRLMRFLTFSVGEFEDKKELEGRHNMPFNEFLKTVFFLNDDIVTAIIYSIAYCITPSDPTGPALARIRRYLRSVGRYGSSPFLVGHYGGAGEIAQGFCRAAAVSGGVYILGRRLASVTHTIPSNSPPPSEPSSSRSPRYSIRLDDFPDTLTCDVIISPPANVPQHLVQDVKELGSSPTLDATHHNISVARCIAVIDRPIYFPSASTPNPSNEESPAEPPEDNQAPHQPAPIYQQIDTGVLLFPPSTVMGGSTDMAATVLITGEGAMATPKGKWIVYIALPLPNNLPSPEPFTPRQLLQPYLDATLALCISPPSTTPPLQVSPPTPLFTLFYTHHPKAGPTRQSVLAQSSSTSLQTYIVPAPLPPASALPETPDAAAVHAEAVYREVVELLRRRDPLYGSDDSKSETSPTNTFWPPLSTEEESEEEGW